jgi:hypothetical protein
VKGYITQEKGENVNWTKAATFITCKKAWKEETRMMKRGSMECLRRVQGKG